jgi:hypothetical protein
MVLEIVMRALVVYESMFGSTRRIAEAVAAGLDKSGQAVVVGVADAHEGLLTGIDLLVVGGPTQGWSMSRPSTRRGAPVHVAKPESGLTLEPGADTGPGVREWLAQRGQLALPAAAFDTRVNSRFLFTGRASKAIGRQMERHGMTLIVPPESFLVDAKSHLLPGEPDRAEAWGQHLALAVGTEAQLPGGVEE